MKIKVIQFILVLTLFLSKLCASTLNEAKYGQKKLNEWTFLIAHNSHLNWHDSKVLDYASNQELSIDKQLQHGVRGFMFDIDYKICSTIEKLFGTCKCEGVCLCHGRCASTSGNLVKDGFSIKRLEYGLRKVVNFLIKNPSEIVTIVLENYVTETFQLMAVFNRVKNMNKLVFNPYSEEWDVLNKGWPLMSEMVRLNKRLLIVDYNEIHTKKEPGIIHIRDFFLENDWRWFGDSYDWNLVEIPHRTLSKIGSYSYQTKTKVTMDMSRWSSRFFSKHKSPLWTEEYLLEPELKQSDHELKNSDKLFLFNHFYGVSANSVIVNPTTVIIMNDVGFILQRFREKCEPYTGFRKPNFIALDYINEKIYQDLIEPLNI
jgi:hypothetical protein